MSNFRVEQLAGDACSDWDTWVDAALHPHVYHRYGWLQSAADASGMQLILLVCYKGQQRAGLLPLFLRRTGMLTAVFSPPPGLAIAELGPLMCLPALQQHRAEKDRLGVVQAFSDWIDAELRPDLQRFRLSSRWPDPRPFLWAGYMAQPLHAYHRSLNVAADQLWQQLHPDNRNKVRRARKLQGIKLKYGDQADYQQLHRLVRARYAEQRLTWAVPEAYLQALWSRFGADVLRAHVAKQGDTVVAGNLYVRYGDCLCFWVGGFRPPKGLNGINEWLLWEGLSAELGQLTYADLGGGNTAHLCDYKARYNPQLVTYYELSKATPRGKLAAGLLNKAWLRNVLKRLR